MSRGLPFEFSLDSLDAVCRRFGILRLSVFGSALRDDFMADSDLDLLVEFQPGRTPGFGFFRLEAELSAIFGRRVDLNTRASLSPYFRDRVLFEARDLYVAAYGDGGGSDPGGPAVLGGAVGPQAESFSSSQILIRDW